MSALKHFDLHVPISEDGRTTFAEVADILDHLATVYAWHPHVHAFLTEGVNKARQSDVRRGELMQDLSSQEAFNILRNKLKGMLNAGPLGVRRNPETYRKQMLALLYGMQAIWEMSRGGNPDDFVDDEGELEELSNQLTGEPG